MSVDVLASRADLAEALELLRGTDKSTIGLLSIAFLDYRGPVGDEAWATLREKLGDDVVEAIAFWSGIMRAGAPPAALLENIRGELDHVRRRRRR